MAGHVPKGMMRQLVTLQNPTVTVDALGQGSETWSNIATLPVHIEQMDTTETVDDGGPAVQTTYRLLVSYHPDCTTRSRFLWNPGTGGGNRTLNIRSCWDRDQRQRTLEVEAVEVVL